MRCCLPSVLMCVLCFMLASGSAALAETPRVADGFDTHPDDWPWWRGPTRDGHAWANQNPPTEFDETHNVKWKASIPGRGHGSPTVCGQRVFLLSCDESRGAQFVCCFDRSSGEQLWIREVHAQGAMWKNSKSSGASSTPACDGERIFVNFPNSDALFTTALDLEGKLLWQQRISSYVVHQGYGASPALYGKLVIASADNKGGGALMGLDRLTGDVLWKRERTTKPNYSSPILLHSAGRDQLILTGCDLVESYDPLSGKTLWATPGATTECVTSTVTDGQLVYTSGGYPKNHVSAVQANGTASLAWENSSRLYVPSPLFHDGYLYGILDEGIAICWQADSGKEMWKARLGGTFSSSPVLVGNHIYVSNEAGEFFVFVAQAKEFQRIAKNQLGDEVFATPSICGQQIFHRVAHIGSSGERQEILYCLERDQSE